MRAIIAAIRLGLAELAHHRAHNKARLVRGQEHHEDAPCRLCKATEREKAREDAARRRMWDVA